LKPGFREFNRSQESETARGASDEGNLLSHCNGVTQSHNK
jgi:hypothetical protein